MPRKRGPRRGRGSRSRKLVRDNSQGQELQGKETKQQDTLLGKGSNQPDGTASQDQDLQGEDARQQQDSLLGMGSNQPEGIAGRGEDLQGEDNQQQQQESLLGKGSCLQVESVAGRARLATRKRFLKLAIDGIRTKKALFLLFRPVCTTRSIETGEDLDTVTLEQLLRNLQKHEDSWPFVRWEDLRCSVHSIHSQAPGRSTLPAHRTTTWWSRTPQIWRRFGCSWME